MANYVLDYSGSQINTKLGNATTTSSGVMSAEDKIKLNGIEDEANKTLIDDALTEEGQAADAKATGDAILDLQSDVSDIQGIIGNSTLSGFTATDLTGAVNELNGTLTELEDEVIISDTQPTEANNKLWVKESSSSDGVSIPTMSDIGVIENTLNSEIATRQTYVRPNLLDNWYFINPVNQREHTTYIGSGYCIDRLFAENANCKTEITSSGIKFTRLNTDSAIWIQKIYEERMLKLLGKTLTLSALNANGKLGEITFTVSNDTSTDFHSGSFSLDNVQFSLALFHAANNFQLIRIAIPSSSSTTTIIAAKLEIGSGQTLAHNEGTEANPVWVLNEIPDYGEQLLRCQKYLQILDPNIRLRSTDRFTSGGNTILDFYYHLRPVMYNIPSFGNDTWKMSAYGGGSDVTSEYSFSRANTTKRVLNIRATKSSTDGLTDAQLYSATNVYISCEP